MSFPTTLSSFSNPSASDSTIGHAALHGAVNDAIEALEAKVGVNSSAVSSSLDYKVERKAPLASPTFTGVVTAPTITLTEGTTADNGVKFGADVTLYRVAANTLKTDDLLDVALGATLGNEGTNSLKIWDGAKYVVFGDNAGGYDTNLYRSAANVLKTDDKFIAGAGLGVRVVSITSSATPTPNCDTTDNYTVTALAEGATFGAPSGTPSDGQKLVIRIKDNGTARAIDFNAAYRFSSDLPKPTTTVLGKTMYLGFVWNSADSKWDNLAQLNNF